MTSASNHPNGWYSLSDINLSHHLWKDAPKSKISIKWRTSYGMLNGVLLQIVNPTRPHNQLLLTSRSSAFSNKCGIIMMLSYLMRDGHEAKLKSMPLDRILTKLNGRNDNLLDGDQLLAALVMMNDFLNLRRKYKLMLVTADNRLSGNLVRLWGESTIDRDTIVLYLKHSHFQLCLPVDSHLAEKKEAVYHSIPERRKKEERERQIQKDEEYARSLAEQEKQRMI